MSSEYWTREEIRREYSRLTSALLEEPYNVDNWTNRASFFRSCDYHDLAIGDFYKALLLIDDALDSSGEYHVQALQSYRHPKASAEAEEDEVSEELAESLRSNSLDCYAGLVTCLIGLDALYDAHQFCKRGLAINPSHKALKVAETVIIKTNNKALEKEIDEAVEIDSLPKRTQVRREIYPWNDHEPDRYAEDSIKALNEKLSEIAPSCGVRVTELPLLRHGDAENGDSDDKVATVKQLGLFAKTDIAPGATVLTEKSMLTVNNRLHDDLCDACSAELPQNTEDAVECPECMVAVFCGQDCFEQASTSYHPIACDKPSYEAINKDVDVREATDALYSLLLGRAICMAEQEDVNPLDLTETSFIWGDYSRWVNPTKIRGEAFGNRPERECNLPWSFEYNIAGPLHMLTALDLDIFATTSKYDFWILNTLFAKFRGVANARMNSRTGKPEVAAVHPLWCLANHSCAPNVRWEWGGVIKMWARDGEKGEVVRWGKDENIDDARWAGGICAGEEILNHYCDVQLPVKERREWAAGALGGECQCERCRYEASADNIQ